MPTIGTPFPSKDFTVEVADLGLTPTWKAVGGMTGWSGDANEELNETDVFMATDPISNIGREHVTFTLSGLLLTSTDDGQGLLNTHVTARDYFQIRVRWNGADGFTAQARCSTRKRSGKAGNSMADTEWQFSILPSTIAIVGLGPTL